MMAPRKDMMRIIRQDSGFSAKLGFGPNKREASIEGDEQIVQAQRTAAPASEVEPSQVASGAEDSAADSTRPAEDPSAALETEPGGHEKITGKNRCRATSNDEDVPSSNRGQIVYVTVSLTPTQAGQAKVMADKARCSIRFLMRRIAQSVRNEVCDDWSRHGMPQVDEPGRSHGKLSTTVTLTLPVDLAAALTKKHDPLGMRGLARLMGPAFRARFREAFDVALETALSASDTRASRQ